jgi:hypothetical protein
MATGRKTGGRKRQRIGSRSDEELQTYRNYHFEINRAHACACGMNGCHALRLLATLDAARTATRQAEERATRFGHKWVEACDQALDYERERDTLAVEVGRLRSFAERVMALRGRTVTEVTPEGRIIEDLAIEACALAATPAPAVAEAVRALVAAFVDSRLSADGRDPCWCDPTGRGEHLSHCQEKRDALAQLARCAPSLVKK